MVVVVVVVVVAFGVVVGGTVVIAVGPGTTVSFQSASAKSGYEVEVEHRGPSKVEVEFRTEGHRSKFKAEWEHGTLEIEIDEEDDD